MDRPRKTASPPDAASPRRAEAQAGERDSGADERDRLADAREREADERDRLANRREREADERELQANQREEDLERRARRQERTRELGLIGQSSRDRADQAVERARDVVNISRDRLLRAEAALMRAEARSAREAATISRQMARGELDARRLPQELGRLADHAAVLREQISAAAAALAGAEDDVARLYEGLAARVDSHPEYQRIAAEARRLARLAREAEQNFSSP